MDKYHTAPSLNAVLQPVQHSFWKWFSVYIVTAKLQQAQATIQRLWQWASLQASWDLSKNTAKTCHCTRPGTALALPVKDVQDKAFALHFCIFLVWVKAAMKVPWGDRTVCEVSPTAQSLSLLPQAPRARYGGGARVARRSPPQGAFTAVSSPLITRAFTRGRAPARLEPAARWRGMRGAPPRGRRRVPAGGGTAGPGCGRRLPHSHPARARGPAVAPARSRASEPPRSPLPGAAAPQHGWPGRQRRCSGGSVAASSAAPARRGAPARRARLWEPPVKQHGGGGPASCPRSVGGAAAEGAPGQRPPPALRRLPRSPSSPGPRRGRQARAPPRSAGVSERPGAAPAAALPRRTRAERSGAASRRGSRAVWGRRGRERHGSSAGGSWGAAVRREARGGRERGHVAAEPAGGHGCRRPQPRPRRRAPAGRGAEPGQRGAAVSRGGRRGWGRRWRGKRKGARETAAHPVGI